MDSLRSERKARKIKCEICGNREATYNRLCDDCAEAITRLAGIELSETWQYFAEAASTA